MDHVLDRLASALGRRDEAPNLALAREIAATSDHQAVATLVAGLSTAPSDVQSDALKVLYEAGKIKPALIADYSDVFLSLLNNRNNRLVWGGMEALAAVAAVRPATLVDHIEDIMLAIERGSVITRDWGVRVLATIALSVQGTRDTILPFLLGMLESCRPSEFPRHAESVVGLMTADAGARQELIILCQLRLPGLTSAQARRVRSTLRKLNA